MRIERPAHPLNVLERDELQSSLFHEAAQVRFGIKSINARLAFMKDRQNAPLVFARFG
ncbi:hypothetical protein [Sinorhizobium fredii]|uniref:hypothetical protein n=1 Tax=Rhizobium fredii TaxID=380 RepID=UPI003B215912